MWISRKRWEALEERVRMLEKEVRENKQKPSDEFMSNVTNGVIEAINAEDTIHRKVSADYVGRR